jgi:hypothetical protein
LDGLLRRGISLGAWHDFRHTLSAKLRLSGIHPKWFPTFWGHIKVNLAIDIYDRTELENFVQPLSVLSTELLRKTPRLLNSALQTKESVSAEGIESIRKRNFKDLESTDGARSTVWKPVLSCPMPSIP